MPQPLRRIQRREPLCAPPAGVHPVLARVLAQRGVDSVPLLDLAQLTPPDALLGLDRAAALIADAVTAGRRLLVIGDYDADGATSTALCVSTLRACGADIDFLVPDRARHGYGLTPAIVEVAAQRQPALLITVDNGISSHEGIARAHALGMQVVVTDHHLPGATLPPADAIVNPNQPGCAFPGKFLAGVGVAFYVLGAVRRELRARGWFATRPEPNIADGLDLVALGTVADVVALDSGNRVLVEQGLRRIRAGRCRPGIAALIAVAGRSRERITATDLGFALGPRLNAAGRIDDMALGIRCLLAASDREATELATELDTLNRERRRIEADMQQDAQRALARLQLDGDALPTLLCLLDDGWHQGVVGLVASRVKERWHRPVVAFAPETRGSNTLRGSARSIEGLHMRDALALVDARQPGLITRFGGHAMAAGLTLERARFDAFHAALLAAVDELLPPAALQPVLWSDGELAMDELTLGLAEALRYGGPWGQAFPEPLFDGEFELLAQRIVGEKHLKLSVAVPQAGSRVLDAIAFNVDLAAWPSSAGRARLAYRLDVNEYRGLRTPQLVVEQIEPL